jgi:hypothetical protein
MRLGFPKMLTQNLKRTGVWFAMGIACLACMVNVSPAGSDQPKSPQSEPKKERQIQREGAKIVGAVGYFRQSGGRYSFASKDSPKTGLVCLENLMLQRVAEALSSQTEFTQWQVTGELTEYRGANYLTIKTAQRID